MELFKRTQLHDIDKTVLQIKKFFDDFIKKQSKEFKQFEETVLSFLFFLQNLH